MACCAFAVFLVMRLLAPFRALFRSIGLAPAPRVDRAVAWSPSATALAPPKRQQGRPGLLSRPVLLAEALLLAGLAGPAVASTNPPATELSQAADPAIVALIHKNICTPLGWRN